MWKILNWVKNNQFKIILLVLASLILAAWIWRFIQIQRIEQQLNAIYQLLHP